MRVLALGLALLVMPGIVQAQGAPPGEQFTINITAPVLLGDMNWSGDLSADDIIPMELALTNSVAYETLFGLTATVGGGAGAPDGLNVGAGAVPEVPEWRLRGDMNKDGVLDNFDMEPFYNAVFGVPEPSTAVLASLAGSILFGVKLRSRRTASAGRAAA